MHFFGDTIISFVINLVSFCGTKNETNLRHSC